MAGDNLGFLRMHYVTRSTKLTINDQHQISPHRTSVLRYIQVLRIKEMNCLDV